MLHLDDTNLEDFLDDSLNQNYYEYPDLTDTSSDSENEHLSKSSDNEELYPGSKISLSEFVVCLSTLNLKNQWTKAILNGVLSLFAKVLPKYNKCQKSLYKFNKLASKTNINIKKHFYCSKCTSLINENSECNI